MMSGINPVTPLNPVTLTSTASRTAGTSFQALLDEAITQIQGSQAGADQAIAAAVSGQGSITQAMTALEAAQLSLDVGIAARNGVAQAYQTIMNMPLD
jgi:flagellar hook-basal body complex protein FliE